MKFGFRIPSLTKRIADLSSMQLRICILLSLSGAKKKLIPAIDMVQLGKVPADLISKFSLLVYSDPVNAAFKAAGLN